MTSGDNQVGARGRALRFVLLVGVMSLFADFTYEGARGIAGPYLALLGASGAAVGIVAGGGELLGYSLRLVSGRLADATRLYWPLTIAGYVLQMLREQLTDSRNPDPDHLFKEMMQDYCKTFDNKPASTEDFKGIVEKHMLRNMDLDGNHKMDWFFNQYVYGMGMAHYNFHATLEPTAFGGIRRNEKDRGLDAHGPDGLAERVL